MSTPACARLAEHALDALLLFLDVMLDLLGQHLDLGVVKFVVGPAGLDLGDQDLGAVMLDIGFLQQIFLDLALARRIEDLFLDRRVDGQFHADFLGDLLLLAVAARFFERGEQFLDLAMVGFEQCNGVLCLFGHG